MVFVKKLPNKEKAKQIAPWMMLTKHTALSEGSNQVVNGELGLFTDSQELFPQHKEGYSDGQVPRGWQSSWKQISSKAVQMRVQ